LQIGIIRGDDEYLRKVSGMGPKTAQRLILELKNKVMDVDGAAGLGPESEAIDALVSLGYSQYQARTAMKGLPKSVESAEDKIKEALKILGATKK
jgi:Holliday junction DNA helicase RuvA